MFTKELLNSMSLDDKIQFFSNILSFLNSISAVFLTNKFKKTNDRKWIDYVPYICLPIWIIDCITHITIHFLYKTDKQRTIETVLHHIISIICTLWSISFGIYHLPSVVCLLIFFERSTIFLNIRVFIRTYLNLFENKEGISPLITNIIKKIKVVNEALFAGSFFYNRIYIFLKDVLFNSDFYVKMLDTDSPVFYTVNRIVLIIMILFLFLNLYWSSLIIKSAYKNYLSPSPDPDLLLIEKIKKDLVESRILRSNSDK